jgi:hypothetical protein
MVCGARVRGCNILHLYTARIMSGNVTEKVVFHFPDASMLYDMPRSHHRSIKRSSPGDPYHIQVCFSVWRKTLMLVKAKSGFYMAPIALSLILVCGHDLLTYRSLCCPTCQWALYTSPISVVSMFPRSFCYFMTCREFGMSVVLEV